MSKTPYEIRLEVLKMAQEAEMQNYHANREALMNNWQVQVDTARQYNQPIPTMPAMPAFPTQEAVVSKAQFLGEFINNSDKKLV
jgi:hypothetical protein